MLKIQSIVRSYTQKRKIAKDLYGCRDELALLFNEFHEIKNNPSLKLEKYSMISRLQLIYRDMKLNYPLPIISNSKLLKRLEEGAIQTIEDSMACLDLLLEINRDMIKHYGSSTSRSFVPLSQSSICLADLICLTGVVFLGMLGTIALRGIMATISSFV
ncbi:homoserine dehydrogenase (plasmid) [Bacillus mycoides]|uniref:homoserine dehydrogenase n=1 Tax=Bacillus mycoides TaxID=1405 RepID=UPI003F753AB5